MRQHFKDERSIEMSRATVSINDTWQPIVLTPIAIEHLAQLRALVNTMLGLVADMSSMY